MNDQYSRAQRKVLARQAKGLSSMDSEAGAGAFSGADGGLPNPSTGDWGTPQGWDSFKAQYGFYPYGIQNDGVVNPPLHMLTSGAIPEWVLARVPSIRGPVRL